MHEHNDTIYLAAGEGKKPTNVIANVSRMPDVAQTLNFHQSTQHLKLFKGAVPPKMKMSYLVFGALSRMVKVQGECDKPLWMSD